MSDRVVGWMRDARQIAVLTGAGISAESGIPVFRGAGGLWRQYRPEELATPEAFARQPELVWEWYGWRRGLVAGARPNRGHEAIARLEARRPVTVLTQNVDGLHLRAGSRRVLELHGSLWRVRCAAGCGFTALDDAVGPARADLRCVCGAWVRPGVVWFGEALDGETLAAATAAAESADVLLVVGTSAVVYPVAGLPALAARQGARVVEVNVEETPLSATADAVLRGPAAEVLPALEAAL